MGRVERVYIRLYKRYAREEDALNVLRRGTPERFVAKTFTVPVRPKVKAFFATPRLKRGAKEAKLVPLCTQKGRRRKNIKRKRAPRAVSPFVPIRFSRVHAFPPNPTQFGLKT